MELQQYDKKYAEIRNKNEMFLKIFKDELLESGLSDKTIERHISNIDTYLNEYLIYSNFKNADVISECEVNEFFEYFLIYKCFATSSEIKTMASSIKKFYKVLLKNNYIKDEEYQNLCYLIKDSIDEWIEDCEDRN